MTSKRLVAAGFIIFKRSINKVQYLMLQASYGDFHWSPPKGHVDPGESELQAAIRETQEEAGLNQDQYIIHENFKAVLNYEVKGKPKTVIYWLAELKDLKNTEIILSHEHRDLKWCKYSDACNLAKYDSLKQAISQANEYINQFLLK